MQRLNEVDLPSIVKETGGKVLLAGGGKFTAVFEHSVPRGVLFALKKAIATTAPMLEYQTSELEAESLSAALRPSLQPNLISALANQKRALRGYSFAHNPHLEVCEECGDYPVTFRTTRINADGNIATANRCSFCHDASVAAGTISLRELAKLSDSDRLLLSSTERVYADFLAGRDPRGCQAPLNFERLFGDAKKTEGKRIAVWMSDTNNMGDKVPLWLSNRDELIQAAFDQVKAANISIVGEALRRTFKKLQEHWLPFRIIVAGGDDLCIVMDEKYVLEFAVNLSKAQSEFPNRPENRSHPVNDIWLKERFKELSPLDPSLKYPAPFSFAGCFIVTSLHTPFHKIHEIGEELLTEAKSRSARASNSVTWRIMAEDHETVAERSLGDFEKPVFIAKREPGTPISGYPTLKEFMNMRDFYSGNARLSKSHMHMVVRKILEHPHDPAKVQQQLELLASASTERSFGELLVDPRLRLPDDVFASGRVVTLFELMSIGGSG